MKTKIKSVLASPNTPLSCVLLTAAAAVLVLFALQPVEQEKKQSGITLSVMEDYQAEIQNDFTKIVFGEAAAEQIIEYKISDTAVAAPMPNPACYGEADSPAELQWLLDEAAALLAVKLFIFPLIPRFLPGVRSIIIWMKPSWPLPGKRCMSVPFLPSRR